MMQGPANFSSARVFTSLWMLLKGDYKQLQLIVGEVKTSAPRWKLYLTR